VIDEVDNEEIIGPEKHGAGLEATLPKGYLSVSQISQFMKCGRAYEYRYVQDRRIPKNSYMAAGTALHKGAETMHLMMIANREVPPPRDFILEAYSDSHTEQFADSDLIMMEEDVNAGKVKDVGIKMMDLYYDGALGKVIDPETKQPMRPVVPVAAERVVKTELLPLDGPPVPFMGVIDLEEAGTVRDLKTKRKAGSQSEVDNSLQLSLYAHITGKPDVTLDQLVKPTKTLGPRYMRKTSTRTAGEMAHAIEIASTVATDISKGRFPLTMPDSWWCSKDWCPYWSLCRGRKR
jgi:hypothetical protein